MNRRSFLKFGAKAAVVAPIALVACSAPPQETAAQPLSMAMRLQESRSLLNVDDTEYVKSLKPMLRRVSPGQRHDSSDFNQIVDAIEDLRANALSPSDAEYVKNLQKAIHIKVDDYESAPLPSVESGGIALGVAHPNAHGSITWDRRS